MGLKSTKEIKHTFKKLRPIVGVMVGFDVVVRATSSAIYMSKQVPLVLEFRTILAPFTLLTESKKNCEFSSSKQIFS